MVDSELSAAVLALLLEYEGRTGKCVTGIVMDTEIFRGPGGGTKVTGVTVMVSLPSGQHRSGPPIKDILDAKD